MVAALVIGLALWPGRWLKVSKDKFAFSLDVKEHQSTQTGDQTLVWPKILKLCHSRRYCWYQGEGAGVGPEAGQDIDVLSGGKIKKARMGDITGIKQERKSPMDKL